jgi:hypothetical protein
MCRIVLLAIVVVFASTSWLLGDEPNRSPVGSEHRARGAANFVSKSCTACTWSSHLE